MNNKFGPQIIQNINLQVERLSINNINNNNQPNNNADLNNNSNDNIDNSFFLLRDLNDSINKNLSQSVFDLVNCFICLSPDNEPLTCPKCNNFDCKKCLEQYFENHREKKCPLCKRYIKLNELKENKIIEEVKKILHKDENKENLVNELSTLIEEKKKNWENQTNNINTCIEKIFKFQEDLQIYKKEYDNLILNCQKLIEETFQDVNQKIESIINSLLSYNNIVDDSIKKYNDIYENNKKNVYNNSNIKKLINEILSLERKQFNDKSHLEAEQFLNTPIRLVPSFNLYHIKVTKYKKEDFVKGIKTINKGNNFKLGHFELIYNYNNRESNNINCKLTFDLQGYNNKKMCFLLSQVLQYKNKKEKLIPMNLIKNEGNKYIYECNISCEEFSILNEDEINIKTEAIIFTI